MLETLEECPSCGSPKLIDHLKAIDHANTSETFKLVLCHQCDLAFTNPRPTFDTIYPYYQGDNYISHSNKVLDIVSFIYKLLRTYTLYQKEKHIRLLNHKRGTLLDFGCGTGHFLRHCQNRNWIVQGVEPNTSARQSSQTTLKQHVHSDPSTLTSSFDIITAWHVIEHVHDLKKTLLSLKNLLNPQGHLLIAVPNISSFDSSHYKEDWAGLDVPRHLYHFNPSSFKTLVTECGLNLLKTIPMKFDAFYVSMLSEKYKNKGQLLSAFKTGYKSNSKASKTGQYSSLIYVLSK